MGPPNDGPPFGGSVPPTPSPPVALSDLLAQRPFPPPYTPTYERPVTSPDTTLGAADEHSILVVASGDGTQGSPGQQDKRDPLAQDNMSSQTSTTPPTRPVANSSDWLAKRNQLRPSRNQGSKGDWIRGWSEDVGGYGTETYCGCSESSFVGDQSLVVKGGEIKSGARSIWLGRRRPSNSALNRTQHYPRTSSAAMCRNCSRIPSPLNSAAGSVGGMADEPHKKVGMIQKLSGLIQKAKPRWGQDTYKKYLSKTKSQATLEARLDQALWTGAAANTPHGFSDTRRPRSRHHGQRNSHRQSPEDASGNKANGQVTPPKDNAPNKTMPAAATEHNIGNAAAAAPTAGATGDGSSFSSLSENDTMARRISRLHRAQALLDRAQKRDEHERQD